MISYTDKQIKAWNKDIDNFLEMYKEMKRMSERLEMDIKRVENGGKPLWNVDSKKLKKITKKLPDALRKVHNIPQGARAYVNWSKFLLTYGK